MEFFGEARVKEERGPKSVQRLEQSLWPGLRWPGARMGSVLTRAWFLDCEGVLEEQYAP